MQELSAAEVVSAVNGCVENEGPYCAFNNTSETTVTLLENPVGQKL